MRTGEKEMEAKVILSKSHTSVMHTATQCSLTLYSVQYLTEWH